MENLDIDGVCWAKFVEVSRANNSAHVRFNHKDGGLIRISSKSFTNVFNKHLFKLNTKIKIIVGTLYDGTKFTIPDPILVKRYHNHDMFTLEFRFKNFIHGIQFSAHPNIRGKMISYHIEGLHSYFELSKSKFDNSIGKINYFSELDPNWSFILEDNTKIELIWSHNTLIDQHGKTSIGKSLRVYISPSAKLRIAELMLLSRRFSILMSLLFNRKLSNYDHRFSAFFRTNFKLYTKNRDYSNVISKSKGQDYLLWLNEDQKSFQTLLRNYFEKYDKLTDVYSILYENIDPPEFSINQFLNLSQALESFHKNNHDYHAISEDDLKRIKSSIKTVLDPIDYEFVQTKLSRNPSFRGRLSNLLEKYDGEYLDLIGFNQEFLGRLVNTRNLHTHLFKTDKKTFRDQNEIYHACIIMRHALLYMMFIYLGVEKEVLKNSFISYWRIRCRNIRVNYD